MLRRYGHEVVTLTRHNDDLRIGVGGLFSMLHNRTFAAAVDDAIKDHRPDVMQCNNLFPTMSTSAYGVARRHRVAVVQALRNYRTFCANGCLYRDGQVCRTCLDQPVALSGIVHKCYRDSRAASGMMALIQAYGRATGVRGRAVDAFITPSKFAMRLHIDNGFPESKMFSRPNFVDPEPAFQSEVADDAAAVFIGRITPEKGLATLLAAWQNHPTPRRLVIVGDGPQRSELEQRHRDDPRVVWRGRVPSTEVVAELSAARYLVMPSQWYETFGRTIVESLACGTPVVVADHGAMAELVTPDVGEAFTPGDVSELTASIDKMESISAGAYTTMRQQSRDLHQTQYTAGQSYRGLMRVYQSVAQRQLERFRTDAATSTRLSRWNDELTNAVGPTTDHPTDPSLDAVVEPGRVARESRSGGSVARFDAAGGFTPDDRPGSVRRPSVAATRKIADS